MTVSLNVLFGRVFVKYCIYPNKIIHNKNPFTLIINSVSPHIVRQQSHTHGSLHSLNKKPHKCNYVEKLLTISNDSEFYV